jgi:hypothetical protein
VRGFFIKRFLVFNYFSYLRRINKENMKRTFPSEFQKVVDFIHDKLGIKVVLSTSTCFLGHDTKVIHIHHAYNLEKNGLYALLHECGHALQPITNTGVNRYKNIDDTLYPKKFSMQRFINEIDAWDKGVEIANLLGIKIDEKRYEKEKSDALMTYFVV